MQSSGPALSERDTQHLLRLKAEQEKAVADTDSQLDQWKKFRCDYVALQDRLKTLADKTTHQVMVPFGSLAFMPGQLVHTNELLVLLGDNYFLERSARQAVDIVTRRLKELDKNVDSLQKQRELLLPRTQYTSEMIRMAQGDGEQQEIVEQLDEEEERLWRERHRQYIQQAAQRRQREKADTQKQGKQETAIKTDEELWESLNHLQLQEEHRGELEGVSDDDEDVSKRADHPESDVGIDSGVVREMVDDEEDDDEEDADSITDEMDNDSSSLEDTEDEKEETGCQSRRVVTFSHTKPTEDVHLSDQESAMETEDTPADIPGFSGPIRSPADLYRLVKRPLPKSILKTAASHRPWDKSTRATAQEEGQHRVVTFMGENVSGNSDGVEGGKPHRPIKTSAAHSQKGHHSSQLPSNTPSNPVQVVTDVVRERPLQPSDSSQRQSDSSQRQRDTTHTTAPGQEASLSSRPVSKFRAARHKQDDISPASDSTSADQGTSVSSRPMSKFRASRQKQGGGS